MIIISDTTPLRYLIEIEATHNKIVDAMLDRDRQRKEAEGQTKKKTKKQKSKRAKKRKS